MSVADQHHRQPGLLGGHPHLGGSDGLFGGEGQYGKLPVGFQQRELDGFEVGIALDAKLLHQLIQGETVLFQLRLQHLTVLHHDGGPPAQQRPEPDGSGAEHRHDGGQGQQYDDGDQPPEQGDAVVLHGDGGQVGDDKGEHQLGGLQLADLMLAQQPDAHYDEQVEHHGAYEYHKHKKPPCARTELADQIISFPIGT